MDAERSLSGRARAPLKAASAVRSAARRRGKSPGNIVYVYGQKARKHWVLASDLEYANFLDLESDQAVKSYDLDPDRVIAHLGSEGYEGSKPDSLVLYFSGAREMREVKYQKDIETDIRALNQAEVQQTVARDHGYSWRHFTELDVHQHYQRLMNWLRICGVLHEGRYFDSAALEGTIAQGLSKRPETTFSSLSDSISAEWRLVFIAIFRLYQKQQVEIDLANRPLTWSSSIRVKEGV